MRIHHRHSYVRYNRQITTTMSLGELAKLPLEVRRLVWRYFVLPCTPLERSTAPGSPLEKRTNNRRLAILGTNKQIHDEVTKEIEYERKENEAFFTLCGKQERPMVGLIPDLPHLGLSDFHRTDFSQFRKISINIFSPDSQDPGQFLRLHNFICDIATFLRRSKSLPVIYFAFKDDGWKSWYSDELAVKECDGLSLLARSSSRP